MAPAAPENTGLTYTRLFCSGAEPKAMRSAESWLPLMANTGSCRSASWVRNQSSRRTASAGGTVYRRGRPPAAHRPRVCCPAGRESVPECTAGRPAWRTRTPACPDAGRKDAENANGNTAFSEFSLLYSRAGVGARKTPPVIAARCQPLGDGAFGSAEKLPVLPEAPSLRELARRKP